MNDDGKGPYRHCKRGNSYCLDQNCGCVNSLRYRFLYLDERGEKLSMLRDRAVLACLGFLAMLLTWRFWPW